MAYALYARATWPWIVLGWIGLVPWLLVLDGAPSLAAALGLGAAMAVAFELAVFGWFADSMATYAGAPPAAMLALLALAAPLLQPQLVTFAAVRYLARRRRGPAGAALAGACAYVGTEWACGKLFADTLGYCLHGSVWMRQAADVAGAPGLTLVLVLANECVRGALRGARAGGTPAARVRGVLAPVAVAAALVAALLGYGALRCRQLARAPATAAPVTAAIVQANLGHYDRLAAEVGTYQAVRTILDEHFTLTRGVADTPGLDVVIWPETVYPTTFAAPKSAEGAAFDREIAAFVMASGRPLIFGSYDVEAGREFNAAFFLTPSTAARLLAMPPGPASRAGQTGLGIYRKRWLFPLTERVPAWLDSAALRRWLPWLGTWQPGPGAAVVPLLLRDGRLVRVAPLICYDALAPAHALAEVRAGADLIVTLSNDSWLIGGPGARLHLLGAAFLSIETRRPQFRATPTGISAVIDPTGAITAQAGPRDRRVVVGTVVPDVGTRTLRMAWGEWLGPAATLLAIVLVALRRRSARR